MDFIEILKILIPSVLVFLTAYFLIDKFLKNEQNQRNYELRKNSLSVITPIRLRAYERLILVLERTTPSTLILSVAKPKISNYELQNELLATIRQEFGHNLSQQIYVSNEVWNYIRTAQESLIKLVNTCSINCNPTDSASILAEMIIKVYNDSENTPTEIAIEKLKSEVRNYFH
jgi:hypothetical protein